MKKKIREAVEAKDVVLVRTLLIEMMSQHAGKANTLLEISETVAEMPELFVADDGKVYPPAAEVTEADLNRLSDDLRENFSLPKYRLFTEVHARMERDPEYRLKKPAHASNLSAGPENLEGILTGVSADETPRKSPVTKIIGYVLMILGAAASIVGICVPVRFMIGLGIGVLMLGSAFVYASIPRAAN